MHRKALKLDRVRPSNSTMSMFSVPLLACAYAIMVAPLLNFLDHHPRSASGMMEIRYENRVFWPMLAAISFAYVFMNPPPRWRVYFPPHIIFLALYLALAGASILWAFSPATSFTRFLQQIMIVLSIFLPVLFTIRPLDLMRGLFAWFALAAALNIVFVFATQSATTTGHEGYFVGKNTLGQCAAAAVLLSIHEMLHPGRRRAVGTIVAAISVILVVLSDSKTSIGLALLAPLLATLVLILRKATRISPAALPVAVVCCYFALSTGTNFNVNSISYMLYGDWTFTGRTTIWEFVFFEIQRRPLLGWGYQSFWLVGANAPSVVDAPGWVKAMPNAHNGYYDTILETGYIGLTLLLAFVIFTIHSIGRVADRDPRRAWLLLSLAFFVIVYNGLESFWMRGFEFLWIVFLMVAADTARYWQLHRHAGRSVRVQPPYQRSPRLKELRG